MPIFEIQNAANPRELWYNFLPVSYTHLDVYKRQALRFSRKDQTELAGWDEELYAKNYFLEDAPLEALVKEFEYLRKSTVLLCENLNESSLTQKGIANKNELSVEMIGKLIVGHNLHHLNIIRERYLNNFISIY